MKESLFNRDCAGVAISSLCLVHCVAIPLLPILFPSILPFLFNYLEGTVWGSLGHAGFSFVEYVFWGFAFLATSFSLKKLLRPHICKQHHPNSTVLAKPHQVLSLTTSKKPQPNISKYKTWALLLSIAGWVWFLVVVISHLPHILTAITSIFLVASHVSALVFSIKKAKMNQQDFLSLAPASTNV